MIKRKITGFLLTIAMVIALVPMIQVNASVPLLSYDFRTGLPNDFWTDGSNGYEVVTDSDLNKTVLKVTPLEYGDGMNNIAFGTYSALEIGTKYKLAVKVKTENWAASSISKYSLSIFSLSAGVPGPTDIKAGTHGWEWYEYEFVIQNSFPHVIGFANQSEAAGTGNFYMDDILFGLPEDVNSAMLKKNVMYYDFEDNSYTHDINNGFSGGFVVDNSQAFSGSKSLKITPNMGPHVAFNVPSLKANQTYKVAMKIKTENYSGPVTISGNGWGYQAVIYDISPPSTPHLGDIVSAGSSGWKWHVATYTPTEDGHSYIVGLANLLPENATGELFLDDIIYGLEEDVDRLMTVLDPPFQMLKYDFEDGLPPLLNEDFSNSFERSNSFASSGHYSIKMNNATGVTNSFVIDVPKVRAGEQYTLAMKIKTVNYFNPPGNTGYEPVIYAFGEAHNTKGIPSPPSGSEDWKWYSVQITMQTDSHNVVAGLINQNDQLTSGEIYIDDLIFGLSSDVSEILAQDAKWDMINLDFEDNQEQDDLYLQSKGFAEPWNSGFIRSQSQYHSGSQSLLLNTATAKGYSFWYPAGNSNLMAGVEYTFSIKVKTIHHTPANLNWQMALYAKGGGRILSKPFKNGSNDWEWYILKITFTEAEVNGEVVLTFDKSGAGTSSGEIYIDDLAFGLTKDVNQFMNEVDKTDMTTIIPSTNEVTIVDNVIYGISPFTTVEQFKSKFVNSSSTLFLYDKNNQPVNGLVGTGMTVKLVVNKEIKQTAQVLISMDITGDGLINNEDITEQWNHIFGRKSLADLYFKAAKLDVSREEITIFDIMAIREYMLSDAYHNTGN